MASITKKQIRDSIMQQLRNKGADTDFFVDMIDDYMRLWSLKRKLSADINKRGIVYEEIGSQGNKMTKNNPSTKELVIVNKQMLDLLKQLDITTGNSVKNENEEDSSPDALI